MQSNHPQYISTTDFANFLGISTVAVIKRIQSGKLKAKKIGRSYAIDRTYIEAHFPAYSRSTKEEKEYVSVIEAASVLGVSRMTVFNRIKNGQIPAKRVGRHYVIEKRYIEKKVMTPPQLLSGREYVSVMEFALITGSNRKTVLNRINRGVIKAEKIGRHYSIAVSDIFKIEEEKQKKEEAKSIEHKAKREDYVSVMETAKQLGISRIAVFKKIKKGQIRAIKIGRSFAIKSEDVRSFLFKREERRRKKEAE